MFLPRAGVTSHAQYTDRSTSFVGTVTQFVASLALMAVMGTHSFAQDRSRQRNSRSSSPRDKRASSKSTFDRKALSAAFKEAVARKELSGGQASEANRLMSFYLDLDKNGNRILEPGEFATSPHRATIERRIREAGEDPSRPLSLTVFMAKRLRNAGIRTEQVGKLVTKYTKPSRHHKVRERINVDLPEKYVPLDTDKDNQLGLYEWPRATRLEFFSLDRNEDGFVTPRELLLVEKLAAEAAKREQKRGR
jgi:hypothetical protein